MFSSSSQQQHRQENMGAARKRERGQQLDTCCHRDRPTLQELVATKIPRKMLRVNQEN